MEYAKTIALLITLTCLVAMSVTGQQRGATPHSTRNAVPKPKPTTVPTQTPSRSKVGGQSSSTKLRVKYDPSKNETKIDVPSMHVHGSQFDGLRMFISFTFTGRKMSAIPSAVTLVLSSTSNKMKYINPNQRELSVSLDGESLNLGQVERFYTSGGLSYVTEGLRLAIPSKIFLQITRANQVKMKLGTTEFQLRASHLEALRELADKMTS